MYSNRRKTNKKDSPGVKPWEKPLKQNLGARKEMKTQEPSTSKEDIQDSNGEEYAVNAKIHQYSSTFHQKYF